MKLGFFLKAAAALAAGQLSRLGRGWRVGAGSVWFPADDALVLLMAALALWLGADIYRVLARDARATSGPCWRRRRSRPSGTATARRRSPEPEARSPREGGRP